jgi:hypothetical protein
LERQASLANLRPFQPGNPGRPKGSKNQFVEDFWRDLRDAWKMHGRSAIERMVLRDMPDKFVTVAAGKIPAKWS